MTEEKKNSPNNESPNITNEKEQYWYFSWGYGQKHPNCYTKIWGTCDSSRDEMFRRHGSKWAFQYSQAKGEEIVAKWGWEEIA